MGIGRFLSDSFFQAGYPRLEYSCPDVYLHDSHFQRSGKVVRIDPRSAVQDKLSGRALRNLLEKLQLKSARLSMDRADGNRKHVYSALLEHAFSFIGSTFLNGSSLVFSSKLANLAFRRANSLCPCRLGRFARASAAEGELINEPSAVLQQACRWSCCTGDCTESSNVVTGRSKPPTSPASSYQDRSYVEGRGFAEHRVPRCPAWGVRRLAEQSFPSETPETVREDACAPWML